MLYVVSVFCFLVVAEIVLGDTYLPYQLCRCVFFFVAAGNSFRLHRSVFWLWREIVLGVTSLPIVTYQLCRCVSFLVAAGNSFWLGTSGHTAGFTIFPSFVASGTKNTYVECTKYVR